MSLGLPPGNKFRLLFEQPLDERPMADIVLGPLQPSSGELEKDFVENLGKYQKEALQRFVAAAGMLLWEEHQWAIRSLSEGIVALDGQETLVAAGYFIMMFEHLAPWFKQHKHKLRFQGEKPKLTLV
jgi:hypothetical protein